MSIARGDWFFDYVAESDFRCAMSTLVVGMSRFFRTSNMPTASMGMAPNILNQN
jgi:hypothetical protein